MKLLGEIELDLGEHKVVLKPTFAALVKIEDMCGKSIGQLYKSFLTSNWSSKDITAIVYGGMFGANNNRPPKFKFEEIGEMVVSKGVVNFKECAIFITAAYSGMPISEFEAKEKANAEAPETVDAEKKT